MALNARWAISLAAAIAIAAIGWGCGGGGAGTSEPGAAGGGSNSGGNSEPGSNPSPEPTSKAPAVHLPPIATSSLSKAAFIKQASTACERESEGSFQALEVYVRKHSSEGVSNGVVLANAFRVVVLPAIEAEIAAVHKLGAPAGDKKEIEAILAAQQEAVDEVKELKEVQTFEDVSAHFADASKKFEKYGIAACTKGG